MLGKYSRDLTSLAREGQLDPVVGRHGEMRRLIDVLGRRTKNRCEADGGAFMPCPMLLLLTACAHALTCARRQLTAVSCVSSRQGCQQPHAVLCRAVCCVCAPVSCLRLSAVLVGEPGVGKTSIIHGLAQRLVAGDVPESISGAKLIGLELGLLTAGGWKQRQPAGACYCTALPVVVVLGPVRVSAVQQEPDEHGLPCNTTEQQLPP